MTLSAHQENYSTRPLAAIYVRVSTEDQAKEGFSLAAQEEALKNYCAAKGYDILKVYKDEGKSAKDMIKRPAMQELLGDAESRKFSAIFIYKLDRFSRSLKDLILTMERIKSWGIDFNSLQDNIDTTTANGKLMFHIISAFAEFERNVISERTSFGMAKKSLDGGAITKAPMGYRMVNKRLEVDNLASAKVRDIYQDYLTGNISLNKLSKKYGYSVNGIKKLLKNRTYLGEAKFAGKVNKGVHQPILDTELFDQVQARFGGVANVSPQNA